MTFSNINISNPNDGLGDKLRTAFSIVNDNFDEVQGQIDDLIALEVEVGSLGATVSIVENDIDVINNDIDNINLSLGGKANMTQLNSAISEMNRAIINLQDQVNGATVFPSKTIFTDETGWIFSGTFNKKTFYFTTPYNDTKYTTDFLYTFDTTDENQAEYSNSDDFIVTFVNKTINSVEVWITFNGLISDLPNFEGYLVTMAVGESNRASGTSGFGTSGTSGSSGTSGTPQTLQQVTNLGSTTSNNMTVTATITANSFVKSGGTSSQFLKADGSTDSTIYGIDSNLVHKTGDEVIEGNKTFTNNTFKFGNATISATSLTASRTYTLPNQAGSIALDANVVHMTGNENIDGIKNFQRDLIVNGIDIGRGNSNTSVLIGNDALKSNTGGSNNVAIGYQAIFSATNSSYLVAVGQGALKMNSSGSAAVAIGSEALSSNTTGNNNTAVGRESLKSNTQGFGNSAVGRSSLFTNDSGNNNSAFGNFSLYSNISGDGNVAIGASASSNTTGNNNIAIGLGSLQNNTTGGSNIAIGVTSSNLGISNTNSIVIGTGAVGLGSNTTVIGNTATTVTGLYGNIRLVSGMATVIPATITAPGTLGDIRVTSTFIYVCIATNSWRRTALTTW